MAPTKEQCSEVVKLYYETKSPVTVIRMMRKKYPDMGDMYTKQIQRIVQRFAAKGSIEDGRHRNPGRPRSVRNYCNIKQIKTVIDITPQRSIRKVLGDLTNSVSSTSVYRMLKYDLKLKPYSISIMQHLKPTDIASRLSFANWMIANNHIVEKIWFSDEAHFHLNAQVNNKTADIGVLKSLNFTLRSLCMLKR